MSCGHLYSNDERGKSLTVCVGVGRNKGEEKENDEGCSPSSLQGNVFFVPIIHSKQSWRYLPWQGFDRSFFLVHLRHCFDHSPLIVQLRALFNTLTLDKFTSYRLQYTKKWVTEFLYDFSLENVRPYLSLQLQEFSIIAILESFTNQTIN